MRHNFFWGGHIHRAPISNVICCDMLWVLRDIYTPQNMHFRPKNWPIQKDQLGNWEVSCLPNTLGFCTLLKLFSVVCCLLGSPRTTCILQNRAQNCNVETIFWQKCQNKQTITTFDKHENTWNIFILRKHEKLWVKMINNEKQWKTMRKNEKQ